jgi:hypothetical protein
LGATRRGDEKQIGAVDLKRRRTAVQTHPISPAAMAGVGRNNSAKGRRRARRQSSRVRVRTRARERERVSGLGQTRWVGHT